MEERKRVEAAKEHMHKLSAAREEQLYALKASLLAERCACPSHGLHQRTHLVSMMMCSMLSFLYMLDSLAALPREPRRGRMNEEKYCITSRDEERRMGHELRDLAQKHAQQVALKVRTICRHLNASTAADID